MPLSAVNPISSSHLPLIQRVFASPSSPLIQTVAKISYLIIPLLLLVVLAIWKYISESTPPSVSTQGRIVDLRHRGNSSGSSRPSGATIEELPPSPRPTREALASRPTRTTSPSLAAAQEKLERRINISADTIQKIGKLIPTFYQHSKQSQPGIVRYPGRALVFSVASIPGLVFKTLPPDGVQTFHQDKWCNGTEMMNLRFENMIRAKQVCLEHDFDLLVIPQAKKFQVEVEGKIYTVIAEEKLHINTDESAQEEFYYLHSEDLNRTAMQLARFIKETKFSDVEWRNMPMLDTDPTLPGSRRIALVDLEEMEDAEIGIFGGGFGRRGLMHCLFSESQIDDVIAIGGKENSNRLKQRRLSEITEYQALQEFHVKKGFKENPRAPIQIGNWEALGLNLEETQEMPARKVDPITQQTVMERRPVTLREAVENVVAHINRAIAKTPDMASTKGKRRILISESDSIMNAYQANSGSKNVFWTPEDEEKTWMARILKALVLQGYIFSVVKRYPFVIQA